MSDEQWEPITDPNHMLRPGVDQIRRQEPWAFVAMARTMSDAIAGKRGKSELQFRKPKQQPEPEQPANVDRGERYQRRIYQSIDGPGKGSSIVIDLADVFNAFNVPYMLGQAVKKSIIPGNRGAKDRLRDLREAAWHINRQIQIEEAKGNGTV